MEEEVWLEGWYDPLMVGDWDMFLASWAEDDEAEQGFVHFPGGYYNQEEAWDMIESGSLLQHGPRKKFSD